MYRIKKKLTMVPSTANQAILGTELREHGRESRKGKKNLTHSQDKRTVTLETEH